MVSTVAAVKPSPADSNGFQMTEIGWIPNDWQARQIKEVCRLVNGRGFKPHEWRTSGLPIIRIQNLNGSNEFNYFDSAYAKKLEVENGQLLFAWSGSRGTSFGPHIWHGQKGLLNYHTWKIAIDSSRVDDGFLYYALKGLTKFIEDQAHGASALVHVQKWQMEGFQIALPVKRAEQKKIADALSDADALIESLEQLIAKKRDIKQGAMQELLSGKRRLEGFTDEWAKKSFGEIFDFLSTATNSRSDLNEDEGAYYVHYGDIHTRFHGHLDFRSQQPSRIDRSKCKNAALIKNGDWIMADASEDLAGVGKCIEIAGLRNGDQAVSGLHTFLLREKRPTFVQGYKGHLGNLKSLHNEYMRVMTGMKVFGVSKTALKNLMLPVPSEKEQREITAILNDMETDIQEIEAKAEKVRHCKQGMMQELLSGRIRLI